jgi:hypothetical protein
MATSLSVVIVDGVGSINGPDKGALGKLLRKARGPVVLGIAGDSTFRGLVIPYLVKQGHRIKEIDAKNIAKAKAAAKALITFDPTGNMAGDFRRDGKPVFVRRNRVAS